MNFLENKLKEGLHHAADSPTRAGKPCLDFGLRRIARSCCWNPQLAVRVCCSNELLRAARCCCLLPDGRRGARAPGNLRLLRFFPPVQNHRQTEPGGSKGDSSGCCGSTAELSGVRKFQSRQPAGRSTWRPGVSRRGQDILPAGKSS